jgi:hypothetical protein
LIFPRGDAIDLYQQSLLPGGDATRATVQPGRSF